MIKPLGRICLTIGLIVKQIRQKSGIEDWLLSFLKVTVTPKQFYFFKFLFTRAHSAEAHSTRDWDP